MDKEHGCLHRPQPEGGKNTDENGLRYDGSSRKELESEQVALEERIMAGHSQRHLH